MSRQIGIKLSPQIPGNFLRVLGIVLSLLIQINLSAQTFDPNTPIFSEYKEYKLKISQFIWNENERLSIDSIIGDTSSSLNFSQAPQNFSFGFRRAPIWIQVDIPSKYYVDSIPKVLLIDNPSLHMVDLYIVRGDTVYKHIRSGCRIPTYQRNINSRLIGFQIQPHPGDQYWFQISSMHELHLLPKLMSKEAFFRKEHKEALGLGLYYGYLATIVLAGFCIYFFSKHKFTLYITLYFVFSGLVTLSWDRMAMNWIIPYSQSIHGGEYVLFALISSLLFWQNIRVNLSNSLPKAWIGKMYKSILTLFSVQMLALFICPFLPEEIRKDSVYIITLAGWVIYVPLISLTIYHLFMLLQTEGKKIRFLLFSIIILMIGIALLLAEFFGLINRIHDSLYISLYVGFTVSSSLLFVHIGAEFKNLIRQKAQALKDKLQSAEKVLHLNQELQQLNSSLEEKVTERTHELNDARIRAEEGARTKASFLATMSHEIRTPMNGIIGMTDLLMDTSLNLDQQEQLRIIQSSGESLLRIINDILDFSKIESGKMALEYIDISLCQEIEDILELLAPKALQKKLDLLYFIDPSVPDIIKGDPVRFRQILTNLVNNAIKFTKSGQIFIEIKRVDSRNSAETESMKLHVSIQDTGIGIPEAKIPSLFTAFEQVDTSTTREYGGTGLGLAICRRLCELMQGEIWVESKSGEGSTFHFTFLTEEVMASDLPLTCDKEIRESLSEKRMLLVDDNLTNLKILTHYAQEMGMIVDASSSPKEALLRLENVSYDMFVLDYHMPEMHGLDLAQEIQKVASAPVLILSSAIIPPEQKAHASVAAFLYKPLRKLQFRNAVKKQLLGVRPVSHKSRAATISEKLAETYPLRILVAEDNLVNQKVIRRILGKLGYEITLTQNGQEAWQMVQETPYDLIFMDVQMPVMDGLEATRRIRKDLGTDSPIIIAMTANAMESDRENCLDAGMHGFTTKPVKPAILESEIIRWAQHLAQSIKK